MSTSTGLVQSIERGMFVRACHRARSQTILFVHGLGESGLCFEHLFHHKELQTHNLLAADLPGYGKSVWRDVPAMLEQLADHLASWLAENGLATGKLTLVGHSMGGVLGVILLERHPMLVDTLINVEGNVSPADCVFSSRAAEHALDGFVRTGFSDLCRSVYVEGIEAPAQRGYYASMRLCDPRQFHLNAAELVDISAAENMAQRMAALPIHKHYVAGVPGGVSERSRHLLDQNDVDWTGVQPSGHWPFIDQVDRFVTLLKELAG